MCDHFFWIVSYPFFGQSDCAIKAMLAPPPFRRESFSHQSECVWYPKGCRVVCMCFFKVCFTMILRWMSILLLNLRGLWVVKAIGKTHDKTWIPEFGNIRTPALLTNSACYIRRHARTSKVTIAHSTDTEYLSYAFLMVGPFQSPLSFLVASPFPLMLSDASALPH